MFTAMIVALKIAHPDVQLSNIKADEDTSIRKLLSSVELVLMYLRTQQKLKAFLSAIAKAHDVWKFWQFLGIVFHVYKCILLLDVRTGTYEFLL